MKEGVMSDEKGAPPWDSEQKPLSSRAPLPHYTRSRTGHARCPSGHHPHATLGGSAPETQQGASGRWLIYFIIVKALRVLYSHTAVSPESSG